MAEYWQILGLRAAPDTREAVDAAFLARFETLKARKDPSVLSELQRAYDVAVSVVSFEADTQTQKSGDDGLTLDDFAPDDIPAIELAPAPPVNLRAPNPRDALKDIFETHPIRKAEIISAHGQDWESLIDNYSDAEAEDLIRLLEIAIEDDIYIDVDEGAIDNALPDDYDGWYESETKPQNTGASSKSHYSNNYEDTSFNFQRQLTMDAGIISFYKRAYKIKGRSLRIEYWPMMIINAVIQIGFFTYLNTSPIATGEANGTVFSAVIASGWLLFCFIHIIPLINVTVRRLHDLNLRGSLYVGYFVALFIALAITLDTRFEVIGLWSVVVMWMLLMAWPGTKGPNKYGPDPREVGL